MNVSLWGYRNDFTKWVVITVDFHKLFTKDCAYFRGGWRRGAGCWLAAFVMSVHVCLPAGTEADYVQWLAHSAESTGSSDGCVLGYKETFLRLRKGSFCFNGRDYAVTKKLSPCPCTLDDYHWYELQHGS